VTHDEIQDRLEAYVDDRLTREERRAMDAHLEQCVECREILDEVAPVDVSALGPTRFDSAAMKRTVRRSMFRTAVNTALLLLAG
jgi:anti-sigma factor RsiW